MTYIFRMRCAKCHKPEATHIDAETRKHLCEDCFTIIDSIRRADPLKLAAYVKGTKVETNGLLTVQQAAERLNVSKRTVYRLIESGEIFTQRYRNTIRIKPADLEQLAERGSLFG